MHHTLPGATEVTNYEVLCVCDYLSVTEPQQEYASAKQSHVQENREARPRMTRGVKVRGTGYGVRGTVMAIDIKLIIALYL